MKHSGEYIVELAVKDFNSTISEQEINVLKAAFDEDPANRRLFDEYRDIWQASAQTGKGNAYNEKEAWPNLKNKIGISEDYSDNQGSVRISPLFWQIAAAAMVLLMLGIGGLLILKERKSHQAGQVLTEYYVPLGSRSKVTLPDGTTVWLNAGSKLNYKGNFSRKNRDVFLEGEGYFDVTKTKIPFSVKVTGATVKVLGTAFNVKAYPEEKIIETTVTRGTVQVIDNPENTAEATRIVLYANQKVSIIKGVVRPAVNTAVTGQQNPDSYPVKISRQPTEQSYQVNRNIVPEIYTSWKDQRWIIEREELQSLAVKLERRYNVKFSFTDESLKHYVFSGILKDETLEQVLEAIKLTAPIHYTINQKQVVLSENKFYKRKP
ncbi:MAG: FecR family protein [Bacteroidales bacterium]|nr:FecR family protein [Bacteroidales bacterium]